MGIFGNKRNIIALFAIVVLVGFACALFLSHDKKDQALRFRKHHLDFGELDYDTEVKASFSFKNTSSNLINIEKVKADCRCTDVSANKEQVLPGEEGLIEVTFRSSNTSGLENHQIFVHTDSPNQETIKLTISALVAPKIEMVPRAISFGRVLNVQDTNPRQVAVISHLGQPPQAIHVSSSSPYVKATLLDRQPVSSRQVGRIKIELCGAPPAGHLKERVLVTTRTKERIINSSIKVVAEIMSSVQAVSQQRLTTPMLALNEPAVVTSSTRSSSPKPGPARNYPYSNILILPKGSRQATGSSCSTTTIAMIAPRQYPSTNKWPAIWPETAISCE